MLVKLGVEIRRDDPDPRVVVSLLSTDVGLAAAMLKTINSPFFGQSSKISSVASAVGLMGMKMTYQLITGLVLRNAVAGEVRSLERFWDSAEKVAGIASFIALKLPGVSRDDAYSFGLFRDIDIPICEAIRFHHDLSVFGDKGSISPQALTLIAILRLDEHFNDEYGRMRSNPEWEKRVSRCLIFWAWRKPSTLICEMSGKS